LNLIDRVLVFEVLQRYIIKNNMSIEGKVTFMKTVKIFLIFILFVVFGCSSDNSQEDECKIELISAIENEDFQLALSILENESCNFTQEEKIINKALIYNIQGNVDFLEISAYLAELISEDEKYRKISLYLSTDASSQNLQNIEEALQVYSQINSDDDLVTYCYTYREDLTRKEQDICYFAGLSFLTKSVHTLFIGLANEGGSTAKQVANKFLLQAKRYTFCTEDRNQNNIIDEVDALLCAVKYSQGDNCDIDNLLLTTKDITIDVQGNVYNYSLLKIKIKSDEDQCSIYEDVILYKLYSKDTNKIILTENYCDQNYSPCDTPDENSCFPCPVFINGQMIPIIDTVTYSLNASYKTIWSSFDAPEDTNMAKVSRDFLKEICLPKPEDCICGRTDPCTEEDLDYYIVPLTITEEALINYLQTHYQEEED